MASTGRLRAIVSRAPALLAGFGKEEIYAI